MKYADQLNHPKWQRRRLERLEAAGWKCEECSVDDQQLHVHHEAYANGLMAWEYDDDQLKVLCHKCHAAHHGHQKRPVRAHLVSTGAANLLDRAVWLLLQRNDLWCSITNDDRDLLVGQPIPYDGLFACFDRHIFESLAPAAMLAELREATVGSELAYQAIARLSGFHLPEPASEFANELNMAIARLRLQAIDDELILIFDMKELSEQAKARSRELMEGRKAIKGMIVVGASA